MRRTTKFLIFVIIFGFLAIDKKVLTQDITVTGSWTENIDASDLQASAGSDLIDTYESASDQIDIYVNAQGARNWRVDVRKSDANWHSDFQLSVRRTSDGTGYGWISGGTSYQEVTDTDQSFFTGNRDRQDIKVQLRLTGVSIQVPTDIYTTTVWYTVVND